MARRRGRSGSESPVSLEGEERGPVVLGVRQPRLAPAEYRVIAALVEAGPEGLSMRELAERTGDRSPRMTLRRVKASGPVWDVVIHMAGRPHGRYRVGWPESPWPIPVAPADSPQLQAFRDFMEVQGRVHGLITAAGTLASRARTDYAAASSALRATPGISSEILEFLDLADAAIWRGSDEALARIGDLISGRAVRDPEGGGR